MVLWVRVYGICSPKQTKIQKLNESRYCPNCGYEMKKKDYYCAQKWVKNKKLECVYLTLIKKLLSKLLKNYKKACKNQSDFIK